MRIPRIDSRTASPEIRATLEGLPALGLFGVLAHAETAFRPWLAYGGALLTALELDERLRELAILQVACQEGSEYEWAQHVDIASRVGVPAAQVHAVERQALGDDSLDQIEQLILDATRQVGSAGTASAAMVEDLVETIGARATVELLLVIGHYTAIARLISTLAIPAEAPAKLGASGTTREVS